MERERFRAQLILRAVAGVENEEERLENLQFFLDIGLLEDKDGRLAEAVREKKVPKLPKGITPEHRQPKGRHAISWGRIF